ncbi:MAG: BatA domain-containing protein [Actinobacteria bacterium]|nr:BatA domain-containing protein [Actinomycetota bacterium]MBU1494384.1 BatA domain-containing protein [Actinomycetota bacterium]
MSDQTDDGIVEEPAGTDGMNQVPPTGAPPGKDADGRSPTNIFTFPMTAIGGGMVLAGVVAFFVLMLIDLTSQTENPYRAIVTWLAIPAVITLGLVIAVIGIVVRSRMARRRGESIRFLLRIEPSNPRYMRNLWLFLGLAAVLIVLVAYGGIRAYETTESVAFCGEACHEVMGPQNTTYLASAHARVPCTECHIGPGRSFWVKSKLDGIRQVWKTMTNTFDRPIATPVTSLRPAQETCEHCHWPEQFYGQQLVNLSYYRSDEANSPWTISLLVNVGGGNPRTGTAEGIHWHMITNNTIEYIAVDRDRQEIPWVRLNREDGTQVVYADPDAGIGPDSPGVEVRTFDCIDCHNRPSHTFEPPATAINLRIAQGSISRDLPFIRRVGLDLLNAEYQTTPEANEAIPAGLVAFYAAEYPDDVEAFRADIDRAAEALVKIYDGNFFPEMKTDYRVRVNNLSHFTNDGCFRCHNTDLVSDQGIGIGTACDTCHSIVAQGPSEDVNELQSDLGGLEFEHPVDIGGVWDRIKCTQCHTPAQGY